MYLMNNYPTRDYLVEGYLKKVLESDNVEIVNEEYWLFLKLEDVTIKLWNSNKYYAWMKMGEIKWNNNEEIIHSWDDVKIPRVLMWKFRRLINKYESSSLEVKRMVIAQGYKGYKEDKKADNKLALSLEDAVAYYGIFKTKFYNVVGEIEEGLDHDIVESSRIIDGKEIDDFTIYEEYKKIYGYLSFEEFVKMKECCGWEDWRRKSLEKEISKMKSVLLDRGLDVDYVNILCDKIKAKENYNWGMSHATDFINESISLSKNDISLDTLVSAIEIKAFNNGL